MKRIVTTGLFVAFTALAMPVTAAPDGGGGTATTEPVQGEGATIICRRAGEPGSLIRKRKICLTEAQWGRLAEEAQRKTDYFQSSNLGGNDGCKVGQPC